MKTMAFTNQKGGSGKTTVAVNLAAGLGERGCEVLLIDLDPQASASSWLGVDDGGRELLQVFTDDLPLAEAVQAAPSDNVSLVPSSSWLVSAEKTLSDEVGAELILRETLQGLEPDRWDFVLLDCPPSLGFLTVSALVAAEDIIIPVETHFMALQGLAKILHTIETVRERLNQGLSIAGILPCRVDQRTSHAQEVVESLQDRFGELVFSTHIRENVRLAEAPSFQEPILQYAPRSRGAQDFRALAEEFVSTGDTSHE